MRLASSRHCYLLLLMQNRHQEAGGGDWRIFGIGQSYCESSRCIGMLVKYAVDAGVAGAIAMLVSLLWNPANGRCLLTSAIAQFITL